MAPFGATHYSEFYGDDIYYRQVEHTHLNQVSEEWQTLVMWKMWDRDTQRWEDVGIGFSSHRLKEY